jgi:hypothetical protein
MRCTDGVLGLKDPSRPFPTGAGLRSLLLQFVAAVGGGKGGSLCLKVCGAKRAVCIIAGCSRKAGRFKHAGFIVLMACWDNWSLWSCSWS